MMSKPFRALHNSGSYLVSADMKANYPMISMETGKTDSEKTCRKTPHKRTELSLLGAL